MASLQIVKIRGIPIRIHVSFLLILPLFALLFGQAFGAAAQAADIPSDRLIGAPWLWGLGLAIALFTSVLIHELAHALYAIRTGGTVRDITLLMIGGVSRIEQPPKRSRDEAWMALVGPLSSLLIGGVSLVAAVLLKDARSYNLYFAFFYLGQLNLFLGVFNLLPAFPMDGGRIVRAVLIKRLGKAQATRVAGNIGKGFAVLFAVFGAFTFNVILLFIALFVYMGAAAETQQVLLEESLKGLRVRDVMTRGSDRVNAAAPVSLILDDMREHRLLALPVVDETGRVLGMTTLDAIRRLSARQRSEAHARDAMSSVQPLDVDEEATEAFKSLVTSRLPSLPVVEGDHLVGTVSQADLLKTIELRQPIDRRRRSLRGRQVEA
ncbi:MAG: site-2 protease family protein [Myxococcaceae bacterium]